MHLIGLETDGVLGLQTNGMRVQKMTKKVIISKGEIITCPKCKSRIAEVLEDLYDKSPILAEVFRGISQKMIPKDKMVCHYCGTAYCTPQQGLHLKHGWNVPTPPPNSVKFIDSL